MQSRIRMQRNELVLSSQYCEHVSSVARFETIFLQCNAHQSNEFTVIFLEASKIATSRISSAKMYERIYTDKLNTHI